MIRSILSTFLSSLSEVLWTKTFDYGRVPLLVHTFLSNIWGIFVVAVVAIILLNPTFSLTEYWLELVLILISVLCYVIYDWLDQKVYSQEKLSHIIPYQNINSIFSIIISFVFFFDTSLIAFFMTLLAALVIIFASIDFKKFTIPKSFKTIIVAQSLISLETLLTWYVLIRLDYVWFFLIYAVVAVVLILVSLIYKKQSFSSLEKVWLRFYPLIIISSAIGRATFAIGLFLVNELWLTMSILLGFIWIITSLLFWYLILKDKPNKKDILVAVLVSAFIAIWYILW